MTRFVVAIDDPGHPGSFLVMVDRRKQKKSFWSNRMDDAFFYTRMEAASAKVSMLIYNNPRVLSEGQAILLFNKQR